MRPSIASAREHWAVPLYRQSYLFLVASGVNAVTSFAFWIVAAHVASTGAVGRAAAVVSAVTIVSYATSAGLPYGILRFGSQEDDLAEIVNNAVVLTVLTSIAAALIFVVGIPLWAPELERLLGSAGGATVFATLCVGASVVVLLDNLLAARRRSGLAAWRNIGVGGSRLLALIALGSAGAAGVYEAALAPIALSAFGVILVLPRVVAGYGRRFRLTSRTRDFFRYSFASFPSSLFGGAPPFILPLIALGLVGPRGTAFFYIAWSVVGVLLMLPAVVANIAVSEGSRGSPWATADKARRFSLTLIIPLLIVLAVAARPILTLFGPEYAAGAATALRIFLISLIPWTIMVTDLSALRVEHRYGLLVQANAAFAVLSLVSTVAFGLIAGLEGMALGWTAGVVIAAAAVHRLVAGPRAAEHLARDPGSASPLPV